MNHPTVDVKIEMLLQLLDDGLPNWERRGTQHNPVESRFCCLHVLVQIIFIWFRYYSIIEKFVIWRGASVRTGIDRDFYVAGNSFQKDILRIQDN